MTTRIIGRVVSTHIRKYNAGEFANGLYKKLKSALDKVSFGSRSSQEEEEETATATAAAAAVVVAAAADHRHSYISIARRRCATRRLFAREHFAYLKSLNFAL